LKVHFENGRSLGGSGCFRRYAVEWWRWSGGSLPPSGRIPTTGAG